MTTFSDAIISEMKNIAWNFFAFSRLISYFEPFQKRDDTHIWYIFELTDSERRGWINV